MSKRSILITGIHRSGSTWIANMLNAGSGTQLIDEPFNLGSWAYRLNGLAEKWYTYIPDIDEDQAKIAFSNLLENKVRRVYPKRSAKHWIPLMRKGKIIIKDPIASLSSNWLYEKFDLDVAVIVRHPLAFVKSLRRMNWSFPFEDLISQDKLMNDHLYEFRDELLNADDYSFEEQALLVWKCIYSTLNTYLRKNKDWILMRHEDVSLNPIESFKSYYDELNLQWTDNVEKKILEYTGDNNPAQAVGQVTHQMKRNSKNLAKGWVHDFNKNQVVKLRNMVEPVASYFYSDADWEL